MLALALKSHIIHVVGFTEGDHAAPAGGGDRELQDRARRAEELPLRVARYGGPRCSSARSSFADARRIIAGIGTLGDGRADPWPIRKRRWRCAPAGRAAACNPAAAGLTCTRTIEGAVYAIDPETRQILPEAERIRRLLPAAAHAARDLPPEGTWP